MNALDLAAPLGFALVAAGGTLLYGEAPSVPAALLPLVAMGAAFACTSRAPT